MSKHAEETFTINTAYTGEGESTENTEEKTPCVCESVSPSWLRSFREEEFIISWRCGLKRGAFLTEEQGKIDALVSALTLNNT